MADYLIEYTNNGWQCGPYKIVFTGPHKTNFCIVNFPSISNMLEFVKAWDVDPPLYKTEITSITRVATEKD